MIEIVYIDMLHYGLGGSLIAIVSLQIFSKIPTILYNWKKKRLKGKWCRVFYVTPNNTLRSEIVEIGTTESDKEIKIDEKSFLFDQTKVTRLPKKFGQYSGEPCLFYVHDNSLPIDFLHLGSSSKTPDELHAVLRTKVIKEIMAGSSNMPEAKSILLFLIGGVIIYAVAKNMGWI